MTYTEAITYLLKNGFKKSLIDMMGKKRCIKVATMHKVAREQNINS